MQTCREDIVSTCFIGLCELKHLIDGVCPVPNKEIFGPFAQTLDRLFILLSVFLIV